MEPIGFDKKKANEEMAAKGIDVLVATSPENVFYTSGLPTRHIENNPILYVLSNQYPTCVVVRRDADDSVISWMYYDQTLTWIPDFTGVNSRIEAVDNLVSLVGRGREGKAQPVIGVESTMPLYFYDGLKKAYPDAKFEVADDIFMKLRFVKSAEEILRIKEATRISEKVLKAMIKKLEEGVSDIDLIKLAKIATLKNGGSGTNHITLSIGDSDPEAPGTGRKIVKGEMTRFDTGAVYKGYVSDISRHACLGPAPEDAKKVVERIVEIQDLCIDAVKPGVAVSEVDAILTNYFDTHSNDVTVFPMGHGVGLNTEEFHFLPGNLWGTESMIFKPGMIFDLEFWTPYEPYKNRLLGMEDTYLVTDRGCKRITKLERKIFEK